MPLPGVTLFVRVCAKAALEEKSAFVMTQVKAHPERTRDYERGTRPVKPVVIRRRPSDRLPIPRQTP